MRGVRSVMQAGRGQKVDASHVGPVGDAGGARGAPYGQGGSEPGPGPGPEKSQEGGFWVCNARLWWRGCSGRVRRSVTSDQRRRGRRSAPPPELPSTERTGRE